MKTKILLAACLLLTLPGCANIDLSNRASKTLDCQEVLITSKWLKWFGITTILDQRDAKAILKDCT